MTQSPFVAWVTWLLDPADLTVGATGTADATSGTNLPVGDSTIAASNVVAALNSTNVTLLATNSITVNAAIAASGNANGGNLTLEAPTANLNQAITLRAGSTLTGTGVTTVNVGANGRVQNGVDVVAANGTVNLAAGTFFGTGQEVTINRPLTLNGAGAANTILDGGAVDRVLFIANNGASGTVNLNNLTITNGNTGGSGGGIFNDAAGISLSLSNATVSGSTAGLNGGGIYSGNGDVTLTNSTVSGNVSSSNGGGIYSAGVRSP